MNDYQFQECLCILEKIHKKPICRLICDPNWKDKSGKINLNDIESKLNDHKYLTVFDFSLDLNLLIEPREVIDETQTTENLILQDISEWLLNKLYNYPRTPEEQEYMKVQKCISKINSILTAIQSLYEEMHLLTDPSTVFQSNEASGLNSGNSGAGVKRLEALQDHIEHIKRPDQLEHILSIIQKHIPHISLAPEIVIEGRYITKACAIELRDYLNSINA